MLSSDSLTVIISHSSGTLPEVKKCTYGPEQENNDYTNNNELQHTEI